MLPQRSRKCSHFTRKRSVYYYRRRLPGSARDEVAVSLFTRHYRPAQHRAAHLDALFARTILIMQNRNKIAAILRQWLRELIACDEAEWLRAPSGQPAYAVWADDDDDPTAADIAATERWLSETRGDALRRHFAGYEEAADRG